MYSANVPDKHDGKADNHGPIAARRRTDGGKNNLCDAHVSTGEIKDGRICMSESNHHVISR